MDTHVCAHAVTSAQPQSHPILLNRRFAFMKFMHICHRCSYLRLVYSVDSNKSHLYFSETSILICDLSAASFNMTELQMTLHSSFLLVPLLTLNHPSTYSCYLSSASLLLLWNRLNTQKAVGSIAASQFKGSLV